MNNPFVIFGIIIVVFISGGLLYIYNPEPVEYKNPKSEIVTCTMEAKLCPDGSYVGRSGPNCEFHCPAEALCEGGTACPVATSTENILDTSIETEIQTQ